MQNFMKRQNETLEALLSESMVGSVAKVEAALASGITLEPTSSVEPFSKLRLKLHRVKNEDGSEGIEARVLNGRKFWIWQLEHILFACVGQRPPPRGSTVSLSDAAFFRTMIINGANRYIFATDTQDIVEFRPRTVSRELFDAEAKL